MMSTERLKVLHSRATRNRKFLCVMNDVAKKQEDLYDGHVDREKVEATQRIEKSIVCTRRNIVRQRVLKQCMKSTREDLEHKQATTSLYGKYHGIPVEQIAGEIDNYIEEHHPRVRRKQKIKQLFDEGYDSGAILNTDTIKGKVKEYFDRPLVEIHHVEPDNVDNLPPREPTFLPPITGTQGFYTGDIYARFGRKKTDRRFLQDRSRNHEDTQTKLFVTRKVSKFLTEHVPDNVSLHSLQPHKNNRKPSSMRPTTLPAIKPDKDEQGRPKKAESIGDLVSRFSQNNTDRTSRAQQLTNRINDNNQKGVNTGGNVETEVGQRQNKKEKVSESDNAKSKPRRERKEKNNGCVSTLEQGQGEESDGLKSLVLPTLKVKTKKKPQGRNDDMGMTI